MLRVEWLMGYGEADGTEALFADTDEIDGLTDHDVMMVNALNVGQNYVTGGPHDMVVITKIYQDTKKTDRLPFAPTTDELRAMAHFARGVIRGAELVSPDGIAILDDAWIQWDAHHDINVWLKDEDATELSAAVYPVRNGSTDGSQWVELDLTKGESK